MRQAVREFRQEERQEFRYLLSVTLAIACSWVFWLIPGAVRGWIADRSGNLFYRISNTYPDNVRDNVQTVLDYVGDGVTPAEPSVRSIFRTSARNFMDLIIIPRQPARSFLTSVRLVSGSWQILDEVVEAGKGGILVSGHVGSFDYIGQVLTTRGYRLTVVTGRTTARFIFDGVTWLRASRGTTLVEPTPSGIRKVMKAVRRNEFAVFVTDRDFFQNGEDVIFMGRQTTLPPGPVRVARETGAPLIPIFSRRVAKGHELTIGEPFHVQRTSDIGADMAAGMERLVEALEEGIIPSLDQWVMFQRVWLEPQRVPVRVFPVGSPLESELLERVATALPDPERLPRRRGLRWRPEPDNSIDS
ncbi:MAG: lysophospholipid acyltransferase family protein [Chloroflexota bacterium]|nr:lysophospholipid acyltransferase family protein [Chloroflexota bacterium]